MGALYGRGYKGRKLKGQLRGLGKVRQKERDEILKLSLSKARSLTLYSPITLKIGQRMTFTSIFYLMRSLQTDLIYSDISLDPLPL